MQKQMTENWNKLYQCISRPATELAQLNIQTWNNWLKSTGAPLEEVTQAKKPEDLLWAQMKLANMANLEALSYAKKVNAILTETFSETNDIVTDLIRETTAKSSELIKATTKSKD